MIGLNSPGMRFVVCKMASTKQPWDSQSNIEGNNQPNTHILARQTFNHVDTSCRASVGGRKILHLYETMQNHCLSVFTRKSSFQGFLGGAGFRQSTVALSTIAKHQVRAPLSVGIPGNKHKLGSPFAPAGTIANLKPKLPAKKTEPRTNTHQTPLK